MLKVSSPQPTAQEPPQPIQQPAPPMGGEQIPPMDGQVPPMGDPMGGQDPTQQEQPNPYEADFDAGVDADEETDPKRFIQQLAGKISEAVRSFNKKQPQVDADLNKYVAGMVIKACLEGLSQEDADEILNKVKSDEESSLNGEDSQAEPTGDDNMQPENDMQQQSPMSNESIDRCEQRSKISELFQELTDTRPQSGQELSIKPNIKSGYKTKPLTSPDFK